MREKLVTILLGLAAGIVFGGLILLGPKILDNKATFIPSPSPQPPKPITNTEVPNRLTIDTPEDHSFVIENTVMVAGKAPAGSTIFIFGPADDKIATASADGSYSAKLKLEDGENEIGATLLGDKMQTIKKSVTLEISQ